MLEGVFSRSELDPVEKELDAHEALVDAFLNEQRDGRFTIAETGAITFAPSRIPQDDPAYQFPVLRAGVPA